MQYKYLISFVRNAQYSDIMCMKVKVLVFLSLKSSAQTDVKFTRKPQESLSSGINVINASDDSTFPNSTPDTDNPAGLTPQPLQPPAGLCGSVRYPSLPGNLDLTSGLSEIQKHVSDPVLPVA